MPTTKTKKRYKPLTSNADPRVESGLENHLHLDSTVEIELSRLNANQVINNRIALRQAEAAEHGNELLERGVLMIVEKLEAIRQAVDGVDTSLGIINNELLTENQLFGLAKHIREGIDRQTVMLEAIVEGYDKRYEATHQQLDDINDSINVVASRCGSDE